MHTYIHAYIHTLITHTYFWSRIKKNQRIIQHLNQVAALFTHIRYIHRYISKVETKTRTMYSERTDSVESLYTDRQCGVTIDRQTVWSHYRQTDRQTVWSHHRQTDRQTVWSHHRQTDSVESLLTDRQTYIFICFVFIQTQKQVSGFPAWSHACSCVYVCMYVCM